MTDLNQLAKLTPKQLKRTLGRPSKYTQNTLAQTIHYLRTYEDDGELIPTREGLAVALGTSVRTVERWAEDEDKPEFCQIVQALDGMQARDIIKGGVRGDIPSKVVALLLSRHGYSEASQGVSGGIQITVNVDRDMGGVTIEGEQIDQ